MDFKTQLGMMPGTGKAVQADELMRQYINLKLMSIGQTPYNHDGETALLGLGRSLLASYQEKTRLLSDYLPPCDQRIQNFLARYFEEADAAIPQLPSITFNLDRHGVARTLSLPADGDSYASDIIDSYRLQQGVLHNPKSDRRTTQGVFHVVEGGLPIPNDKKAVPKTAAARLLALALNPPGSLMSLPYMSNQDPQAEVWSTLLLRPVVVPGIEGFSSEKSMEVRFFAPGNMVSNLDFVESIFGNAGDPSIPENDAALNPESWTGTTGCVILAPQMLGATKKALGLPHFDDATDRQKRDGMCWKKEDERYNDGGAFKITTRDASGVVVTAIADNYFGYCKKEVKTQIGYSANLIGMAEEEHAGGAQVFAGYDLGEEFKHSTYRTFVNHTFEGLKSSYGHLMDVRDSGYAVDKQFPDIFYLPEDASIELNTQCISWSKGGSSERIKLLPGRTYVYPSGYKVEMIKPAEGRRWRLVGYTAIETVCHKPCTVSGGGKSEISKPISDAIISGPVFVRDFQKDFDFAEEIINRNYGDRYRDSRLNRENSRPILSTDRSLGSVIKLLTPSTIEYTDAYNEWLRSIPQQVKDLVLIIKRLYKEDWGDDWRSRFSVDLINGESGNVLRYKGNPLITQYLRVGYTADGYWRTFGLRKDFLPSHKISLEDDITASTVAPRHALKSLPEQYKGPSYKFVHNCEYRFFQRPDDAVIRGYDKQAERDLSSDGSFLSNYEPLDTKHAKEEIEDAIRFEQYTQPMRDMIRRQAASGTPDYYASSAFPRMVNGKPTKNPRYLQTRPDLGDPRGKYLAELSSRFLNRTPAEAPYLSPVTALLPGRRNNPPDPEAGVGPLCVFNPVHYLELPELFMEYISSITGKSPSTTGAGSEGALTKSPFNALPPVYDLNNALVAHLITDQPTFITSAGYVGPKYRVDHDISLLVPEIWSRLRPEEADPRYMIENGMLDKVEDFEYKGETILASRIGYRMNTRFARILFGRVFTNPDTVFTEDMLKPELQDMDIFVTGMKTILAAHKEVATNYFDDGSVEDACPPIRALLHIMVYGEYEGKDINDPAIRDLFTRESMIESDWYQERLVSQQNYDIDLWKRHLQYLENFIGNTANTGVATRLGIEARITAAKAKLAAISAPEHLKELAGTLGRQPI